MSIYRRIMDSKAMDILEVIGDVCVEFIKTTAEVLVDTFNHPCGSPQPQFGNGYSYEESDIEKRTYEYWMKLDSEGQRYYFDSNSTLQKYGELYRYDDREQMARSAAYIAKCTGYAFDDIDDKY